MDSESRVQLTRIEGKLDLLNERHDTMFRDMTEVKNTVSKLTARVGVLEAAKYLFDGERKGAGSTIRALYAAVGLGGGAIIMAFAKHAGWM